MRCWTPTQWQQKGRPETIDSAKSTSPVLTLRSADSPALPTGHLPLCLEPSIVQQITSPAEAMTPEKSSCQGSQLCDGSCLL